MKKILFYFLSFTWGSIASVIGLIMMIPFLVTKRFKTAYGRIYGVFPSVFGSGWGLEMGCFFFTSHDCSENERLIMHEMGHGIQNICWGPLMLFVISIPSMIRFWYQRIRSSKGLPNKPYESIWFEGQATRWGYKYVKTNRW